MEKNVYFKPCFMSPLRTLGDVDLICLWIPHQARDDIRISCLTDPRRCRVDRRKLKGYTCL